MVVQCLNYVTFPDDQSQGMLDTDKQITSIIFIIVTFSNLLITYFKYFGFQVIALFNSSNYLENSMLPNVCEYPFYK